MGNGYAFLYYESIETRILGNLLSNPIPHLGELSGRKYRYPITLLLDRHRYIKRTSRLNSQNNIAKYANVLKSPKVRDLAINISDKYFSTIYSGMPTL